MKPSLPVNPILPLATARLARSFTLAAALSCLSAQAAVINFEGDTADYDNSTSTQSNGVFRDVSGNSQLNISANGAGNDYLVLSGSGTGATVYDTTPSNSTAGTASTFIVGAGQTLTYTVEFQSVAADTTRVIGIGLYNPNASTGFTGYGFNIFLNTGTNDLYYYQTARNTQYNFFFNGTSTGQNFNDAAGSAYRVELTFANNGSNTGATFTTNIYQLDALGGSVTSTVVSNATKAITYGVAADTNVNTEKETLNFDPAGTGLGFYLTGNPNGGSLNIDNISVSVIPEPSAFGFMGGAAAMMLSMIRRRRRA
jgi:hypothetical protein